MDTTQLKNYAPQARRAFIEEVSTQAARYGITAKGIEPAQISGDVLLVGGQAFPRSVEEPLRRLAGRVNAQGFEPTIEAIAYTWFNRFVAIRYMELHGYLDHGYRVLSRPTGQDGGLGRPEILDHAADIELPDLDRAKAIELKLDGAQDEELYRILLKAQCNALHRAMPFLFERIGDETELLLPANLLHSDSLIRQLVENIDESAWVQIEIIGWLYQFYISEKKDQVIGKVVKSEDIPAATQLFTPNWIVKYMVQNTLGAQWLATYPNSPLAAQMEYYIKPAEQTAEVQEQLRSITPSALNPEELTLIDPACGSGHILVEAYELFKAIYLERGYRQRDVAKLILEKNLYGLDIDERAVQLAGFALMMKGRADDRQLFDRGAKLNVMAFVDSTDFEPAELAQILKLKEQDLEQNDLEELKELFQHATTFGSLIQVPFRLAKKLPTIRRLGSIDSQQMFVKDALSRLAPLARQAEVLSGQYDVVVVNPPYMGGKGMNSLVKTFAKDHFPDARSDMFACFIEQSFTLTKNSGRIGAVTPYVWMFISSFERFRTKLIDNRSLASLIQLEYNAFEPACIPVATFSLMSGHAPGLVGSFIKLSEFKGFRNQATRTLQAIRDRGCGWFFETAQSDFSKIPGSPVAYWLSDKLKELFATFPPLSEFVESREGLTTADNDRFLRLFYEVPITHISWNCTSSSNALGSLKKWFPYVKGGTYRKWFGNLEYVVDWLNDGEAVKSNIEPISGRARSHNYNGDYAFRPGFTWTLISSASTGARFVDPGFMFDANGPMAFSADGPRDVAVGLINSCVGASLLQAVSPTLAYKHGHILKLPLNCEASNAEKISTCVTALRFLAVDDRAETRRSDRGWRDRFVSECAAA